MPYSTKDNAVEPFKLNFGDTISICFMRARCSWNSPEYQHQTNITHIRRAQLYSRLGHMNLSLRQHSLCHRLPHYNPVEFLAARRFLKTSEGERVEEVDNITRETETNTRRTPVDNYKENGFSCTNVQPNSSNKTLLFSLHEMARCVSVFRI